MVVGRGVGRRVGRRRHHVVRNLGRKCFRVFLLYRYHYNYQLSFFFQSHLSIATVAVIASIRKIVQQSLKHIDC